MLVGQLLTTWDGKFESTYNLDTGTVLEIERQGPELLLNDRTFAIPNGVAAAGIRDKKNNPRPELWLATRS